MARGVAGGLGPTGFGPSQIFNPGGGGGGFWQSLASGLGDFGNFMSGPAGQGLMGFGTSLANLYGMNKAFDIADSQLDILKDQENRAATAQNLATQNSQSLALQMTTPGTPEHAAVQAAIANGTYRV